MEQENNGIMEQENNGTMEQEKVLFVTFTASEVERFIDALASGRKAIRKKEGFGSGSSKSLELSERDEFFLGMLQERFMISSE